MSAPATFACAVVALCLALPVIGAAAQVEAERRADMVADAAALAAADAASGWIDAAPCTLARDLSAAAGAELSACEIDEERAEARVAVRIAAPLGSADGRARAGPEPGSGPLGVGGPVGENGWAWPSAVRGVSQGHHDGEAIDLLVDEARALYAPYDGVVIAAGPDGGGVPAVCRANPWWWHGPNHTVIIRHEYEGRVLYSSHNHVAPRSSAGLGISVGTRVRAGQTVARAGMSGCTSGPHTHFTLATRPVNAFPDLDPFDYLGDP